MEIQRITRSWLKKNEACYSNKRIAELVPEEGVTLQQVLDTDQIPDEDKIWVVTRPKLLPRTIATGWLAGIVERALGRLENPDPRHVAVVPMLRRIASGEEVAQEERNRIVIAAREDYTDDCCFSSGFAADAAFYAARYASSSSAPPRIAWKAAIAGWCSAEDETAERKQQVQDLLGLLED